MEYGYEEQDIEEEMCHLRRMAPKAILENLLKLQPEGRMSQSKEKLTAPPDKVGVKRGQFLIILPGCGQRAMTNTSEDGLNEIVDMKRNQLPS